MNNAQALDATKARVLKLADERGQFTASDLLMDAIETSVAKTGSGIIPPDVQDLAFQAVDALIAEGRLTKHTAPGMQHVYQRPASGN